MIIEEGTVLILDEGYRYYLAHEIGELEGHPNKKYYFGAGVTENDKLNLDDICFIEVEKIGEQYTAMKVQKDTELYDTLAVLETIAATVDIDPSAKDQIMKEIDKYE